MTKSMSTDKNPNLWNLKQIRNNVRRTVFTKGIKPYLILIVVIFIGSFIGIIRSDAATFINNLDIRLGIGYVDKEAMNAIIDYVYNLRIIKALPGEVGELAVALIWTLITGYGWLLGLLSANQAYMERNLGEVFAIIILFAFISNLVCFFIKRAFSVCVARFMMENRFQKDVKIRRFFAPLTGKNILHIFWVMFIYQMVSVLWWLTIVGGIIKLFQYMFVPYILAENPRLSWKQARDISKQLTKGYKWKIFVAQLTYLYLVLLSLIPFVDFIISLPVYYTVDCEIYFTLRQRQDIDKSLLIEKAFDGKSYIERIQLGESEEDIKPEYVMPDFHIKNSSFDEADKYSITDFIIMFFLFSLVGWLWEVGLHVVKDHAFVNRGTMYGPWLPIYGAGGVFIIALLSRFKGNKPKLFISTMVLCGILEYITSFVLEYFGNMQYWDYHQMTINLNGRVCLAGLLAFAIGGFLGIYILGPLIKNMMGRLDKKKVVIICSGLVVLFIIDLIFCLAVGPNKGEGVGNQYSNLKFILESLV